MDARDLPILRLGIGSLRVGETRVDGCTENHWAEVVQRRTVTARSAGGGVHSVPLSEQFVHQGPTRTHLKQVVSNLGVNALFPVVKTFTHKSLTIEPLKLGSSRFAAENLLKDAIPELEEKPHVGYVWQTLHTFVVKYACHKPVKRVQSSRHVAGTVRVSNIGSGRSQCTDAPVNQPIHCLVITH